MKNKIIVILIIVLISLVFSKLFFKDIYNKSTVDVTNIDKIKSVNLSTDYEIDQALSDIEVLKVNTVNVPIVIEIPTLTSNEMKINEYSKEKAIELIKKLKDLNINVILEAYPWINNGSDYETEFNPDDKEKFFEDWKAILDKLIYEVANKYDVDIIITASNLTKLESYEDEWIEIIEYVKEKFNGLVTYKTSWWYTAEWDEESINRYNEKLNNKIFSVVDFISIAAYFELSDKKENTVEELVEYLNSTKVYNRNQNVVEEIENFYNKYNKEIYFGELGFPRRDYAAMHPWDSNVSDIENNEEQARCFEAYKNVFRDKEYIKGFSLFAVGEKGQDKNFYPSKESIKVISEW